MAGGKETPRQKMIGMMYLVLTALLALNVSKAVLDAFVAIEENIQKANIVQADRGDGFYAAVVEEKTASKGADQAAKKKKLEYVLSRMDEINKETETMIKFLDELKVEILEAGGEDIKTYKDNDHEVLFWKNRVGVKPIRMNCMAVQGKDKYDEPMQVMGIADDIKNPKGKGAELWKKYNDFRRKMVELAGSYKMPGSEKGFAVKLGKDINDYKTNKTLIEDVTKLIQASGANLKEDEQALIDIYMGLTKKEKNEVHGEDGVHWVGMTFDHSPLVAGVAALSSIQQEILTARSQALALLKSKVTTGEYSFNKIMALPYGPSVANSGDEVELKVLMAAFDSDNQPVVTSEQGGTVEYPGNGTGVVKLKAGGGPEWTVSGTVSIKNKSGVPKTERWEHKIIIMKPQGSIELPELNVLYRGYDNKVDPTASGYDQTILSGTNATISKSGNLYIVKPGAGKEAQLTVSGKSSVLNKTVQLKTVKYRVSNLPDPELYWGAAKSGTKGSKAETKLFAKYPPEIPLNAQFRIVNWECQVPGAQGRPPSGTGSDISSASGLLRAAKPDMQVSFICTVVGPDGIQRKKAGSFKI